MKRSHVWKNAFCVLSFISFICLSCTSATIREDDIKSNNYGAIEDSLKKGVKPDAKSLYLAIKKNDRRIVIMFIKSGAELNSIYEGQTILGWAAFYRNRDIVRLVLDNGADVNLAGQGYIPAFVSAAYGGDIEILKMIKEKGAKTKEQAGLALLYAASIEPAIKKTEEESFSIVKFLISEGADINFRSSKGNTALHYAIVNKFNKTAGYLIEKMSDINAANTYGATPLMFAAEFANPGVVKMLLSKGAEVEKKDKYGDTALLYAVYSFKDIKKTDNNVYETVKLIVSGGADVKITNDIKNTPLHLALINEYNKTAAYLIEKKSEVNAANVNGMTPLMIAAEFANPGLVKMLLSKGAEVNMKDNSSRTALFFAVTSYRDVNKKESDIVEVVKALVSKGAEVNIRTPGVKVEGVVDVDGVSVQYSKIDYQGYTPLLVAVDSNYIKAADFLISSGADKNAKEDLGLTPLMIAARNGDEYSDMARMLLAKGVDINAQNNTGWTALMICCQYKSVKIADEILSRGPDLTLKTEEGSTVLAIAKMYELNDLAGRIEKNQAN